MWAVDAHIWSIALHMADTIAIQYNSFVIHGILFGLFAVLSIRVAIVGIFRLFSFDCDLVAMMVIQAPENKQRKVLNDNKMQISIVKRTYKEHRHKATEWE